MNWNPKKKLHIYGSTTFIKTKTNTVKMIPTTFNCIKEKTQSKYIHELTIDGRQVTEKNEIVVDVMQNWYQTTANNTQE